LQFRCPDAETTHRAARALGAAVSARPGHGLVLALSGPLGAGKTLFVKGLAAGLGLDPDLVSSPTFVIVNEYRADAACLVHADLYRLERPDELDDTGFVDLLVPGAVVAVEWADRFPEALPRDRLEVRLERDPGDEGSRTLAASATGKSSRELLEAWSRDLGALVSL